MLPLASASALADSGFIPGGSIGLTQTFYGNAGGYETATAHPSLSLSYNFAPRWSLLFKWDRTWGLYDYTGQASQQYNYFSQPAATLSHDYGKIQDSDVRWSSSIMLENQTTMNGTGGNFLLAQTAFDFASYVPRTDWIKANQFALAPMYVHGSKSKGTAGNSNALSLALLTDWTLPAGFSFRLNAYAFREWYSGSFEIEGPQGQTYQNANFLAVLAWLKYEKTLVQFDESTSLAFNFIGGLDPYIASSRNSSWQPFLATNFIYEWLGPTVEQGTYNSTYVLFALPALQLNVNLNKQVSLNLFVQIKYSNQVWGQTESGWSFQPQAGFGITYNF